MGAHGCVSRGLCAGWCQILDLVLVHTRVARYHVYSYVTGPHVCRGAIHVWLKHIHCLDVKHIQRVYTVIATKGMAFQFPACLFRPGSGAGPISQSRCHGRSGCSRRAPLATPLHAAYLATLVAILVASGAGAAEPASLPFAEVGEAAVATPNATTTAQRPSGVRERLAAGTHSGEAEPPYARAAADDGGDPRINPSARGSEPAGPYHTIPYHNISYHNIYSPTQPPTGVKEVLPRRLRGEAAREGPKAREPEQKGQVPDTLGVFGGDPRSARTYFLEGIIRFLLKQRVGAVDPQQGCVVQALPGIFRRVRREARHVGTQPFWPWLKTRKSERPIRTGRIGTISSCEHTRWTWALQHKLAGGPRRDWYPCGGCRDGHPCNRRSGTRRRSAGIGTRAQHRPPG